MAISSSHPFLVVMITLFAVVISWYFNDQALEMLVIQSRFASAKHHQGSNLYRHADQNQLPKDVDRACSKKRETESIQAEEKKEFGNFAAKESKLACSSESINTEKLKLYRIDPIEVKLTWFCFSAYHYHLISVYSENEDFFKKKKKL